MNREEREIGRYLSWTDILAIGGFSYLLETVAEILTRLVSILNCFVRLTSLVLANLTPSPPPKLRPIRYTRANKLDHTVSSQDRPIGKPTRPTL